MYSWSFDEGQEERGPGERLAHDFSVVVQHLIDLPLKYESLSILSIAREDCGFFAAELAMVSRASSLVVGCHGSMNRSHGKSDQKDYRSKCHVSTDYHMAMTSLEPSGAE
jgi:hypothetical protein